MLLDLIDHARRIWGRTSTRLLLGAIAFGTAFTQGVVHEVGNGLFPLIDGVHLTVLVAFYSAGFFLSVRVFQLFVTTSRGVVVGGLWAWRDMTKRIFLCRWLFYWPLMIRYRLRRHVWTYYAFWWVGLLALFVLALSMGGQISDADRAVLELLSWFVGQVAVLILAASYATGTYVLREYRKGTLSLPPESTAAFRQARALPSTHGLGLALRNFLIPFSLLLLFASADTAGNLYVASVKYGRPSVSLVYLDDRSEPGSVMLWLGTGAIFFPEATRTATFIPVGSILRIEAVPPLRPR